MPLWPLKLLEPLILEDLLPLAAFAMNNAKSASIGETPYYLNYGVHPEYDNKLLLRYFSWGPRFDSFGSQSFLVYLSPVLLFPTFQRFTTCRMAVELISVGSELHCVINSNKKTD